MDVSMTINTTTITQDQRIERELDFVLSHFADETGLFPRTISTKTTEGRQFLVNSKEEVIARFKQAEYMDCRINAFPSYIEHRGKMIQKSNFIFIDIDRQNLGIVNECLEMIDDQFGNVIQPTVLFTGNGYHIYLPIEGKVLEDNSEFNEFGIDRISQKFLKFASIHFSNGKSDPNNNPSFKNCLLRVPSTINSKCGKEVSDIQNWNGVRPSIKYVICDFLQYLRIQQIKEDKLRKSMKKDLLYSYSDTDMYNHTIPWIETLLNTPIDDYRKNAIALILAPYLVTIRGFNFNQAHETISSWLIECNKLRRLDFNVNRKVNEAISNTSVKSIPPMRLATLRNKNQILHDTIILGLKGRSV